MIYFTGQLVMNIAVQLFRQFRTTWSCVHFQ